MSTPKCYAVRSFSHWQGAKNPGEVIAVLKTEEEADRLVSQLSTCSFCGHGQGGYRVGSCFGVWPTTRLPAGYGLLEVDEADLNEAGIDADEYARTAATASD